MSNTRGRLFSTVAGIALITGFVFSGSAVAEPESTPGVLAQYNGKTINLAQSWEGAEICSQELSGTITCYDAPANRTMSLDDCPYDSACLWANAGASGRRLQWRQSGEYELSEWGFRDQATVAYNNKFQYGFILTDKRTGQPDPSLSIGVGDSADLRQVEYRGGGTWNDKVDKVEL